MSTTNLPGIFSPIAGSLGVQQLTSITSTAGTTLTVPTGAKVAYVQAQSQGIIWTWNGTVPSATNGNTINSGDGFYFVGSLTSILLLQVTAGAVANVSYYT